MDSNYHIFKKKITTNKKTTHKWYYFWNDPVTGKMYQRVCKGCKTQAEAYAFVSALPPLFVEEKITIAKIAEWMYVPGGPHLIFQFLLSQSSEETAKRKIFSQLKN